MLAFHRTLIGILYTSIGLLSEILLIRLLQEMAWSEMDWVIKVLAITWLLFGITQLLAGLAMVFNLWWWSWFGYALHIPFLFNFPIGTVIGLYGIWFHRRYGVRSPPP